MHPRTVATLNQLKHVEWFERVGIKDAEGDAEVLGSWHQAIESCDSPEWEDLCLEAANQFCERLVERSPARFSKWNDVVRDIKPTVLDFVKLKTRRVITENDLPKVFIDSVNWDILNLCMESEYADVFPPAFFASQGFWYMSGHFPCGWKGQFPEGKIIIF